MPTKTSPAITAWPRSMGPGSATRSEIRSRFTFSETSTSPGIGTTPRMGQGTSNGSAERRIASSNCAESSRSTARKPSVSSGSSPRAHQSEGAPRKPSIRAGARARSATRSKGPTGRRESNAAPAAMVQPSLRIRIVAICFGPPRPARSVTSREGVVQRPREPPGPMEGRDVPARSVHQSSSSVDSTRLKTSSLSRKIPVPRATAVRGSSATRAGTPR